MYATAADLAAPPWGQAPANADLLLRHASELVGEAVSAAIYETTDDGDPVNAAVAATLRDATCAQAAAYAEAGVVPGSLSAPSEGRVVASKTLGSRTVAYEASTPAQQAARDRLAAGDTLVPAAFRILRNGGLISNRVRSVASGGGGYAWDWL